MDGPLGLRDLTKQDPSLSVRSLNVVGYSQHCCPPSQNFVEDSPSLSSRDLRHMARSRRSATVEFFFPSFDQFRKRLKINLLVQRRRWHGSGAPLIYVAQHKTLDYVLTQLPITHGRMNVGYNICTSRSLLCNSFQSII